MGPSPTWIIGALIPILTVVSSNQLLTFAALITLVVIWHGAFKSPYRVIMASYLTYQWLQASTKIWIASALSYDLSIPRRTLVCADCNISYFEVVPTTELSLALALGGIAVLSLACRLLEPRFPAFDPAVSDLSPSKLLLGYLFFLVVDRMGGPFIGGGFAQAIIALGALKFIFAILLAFYWLKTRRGGVPLIAVVLLELAVGFSGYFSDFKTIFIVVGIGLLTAASTNWKRVRPVLAAGFAILLVLGTVWTIVKPAYRDALNEGKTAQVVTLGLGDRFATLSDLVDKIDAKKAGEGILDLAARLAYTDIFSFTLQHVPNVRPHEGGALWTDAILYIFTPRVFFPEKPALQSDSERTMRYTGRWYGSDRLGASVSIGYLGEAYIDFGYAGIVAVPFLLGLFYALLARHMVFLNKSRDTAFIVAMLIVLMRQAMVFESSNIKLFPGMVWAWIVCGFAAWFLWPAFRHLFKGGRRRPVRPAAAPRPNLSRG